MVPAVLVAGSDSMGDNTIVCASEGEHIARRNTADPGHRGQPPGHRHRGQGQPVRLLVELKVLSAGWAKQVPEGRRGRDKVVDRRARALPAEYRSSLATLDRSYYEPGRARALDGEELTGEHGLQGPEGRYGECS